MRTRKKRLEVVPEYQMKFLKDGRKLLHDPNFYFNFSKDHQRRPVWERTKYEIMEKWAREHPGTRPWAWWRYDAPRDAALSSEWREDVFPIQRRKLSGSGIPAWERTPALFPVVNFGVPSMADIDWGDLPIFESQATYLKRHGLLPKSEENRLETTDFEPEVINFE